MRGQAVMHEPPRRALNTRRGGVAPRRPLTVPRDRPLSPHLTRIRLGAGEASHHLNVIEFTADLIFSTITSASSVPCLPLRSYTLGARPR
jgi:hypothetical protein